MTYAAIALGVIHELRGRVEGDEVVGRDVGDRLLPLIQAAQELLERKDPEVAAELAVMASETIDQALESILAAP